MTRRAVYVWAVVLALVGLSVFGYKVAALGFPLAPESSEPLWDVEIRVHFEAVGEPVKVTLGLPSSGGRYAVVDENFVAPGYGLTTSTDGDGRHAIWSLRWATGEQALYYRCLVQPLAGLPLDRTAPEPPPAVADLDEVQFTAAYAILYEVVQRSADVETLSAQLLTRLRDDDDVNVALLVGSRAGRLRRLRAAQLVLGLREVPARVRRGVRLEGRRRDAALVDWLEVWDGQGWLAFDPDTGARRDYGDVLPLLEGAWPLAEVRGGESVDVSLAVRESEQRALAAAAYRGSVLAPDFNDFSLRALPIGTQEVYRVLLLIPVGAFLLVLLRNLVGIKTFGTFMPVLIALAFRETELAAGIVLFTAIVVLGLAVRTYLERLQLLMVPRVAAVLIVVVLLMLALSIVSHRMGFDRGLSIALFPMVILTLTIERMSVVWEERGLGEAVQQGVGSLLVAILAYLVMVNAWVTHWIFVFPELLLVLLAGCLLVGCYSGYRLLELRRFRELARAVDDA